MMRGQAPQIFFLEPPLLKSPVEQFLKSLVVTSIAAGTDGAEPADVVYTGKSHEVREFRVRVCFYRSRYDAAYVGDKG